MSEIDRTRQKLGRDLRAAALPTPRTQGAGYLGTTSTTLNITAPRLRKLARDWVRANAHLACADVLALCDRLFASDAHHEKAFAAIVLGYHPRARAAVTLKRLDAWLDQLHGWAEVDALCQNVFQAEQMLGDWVRWKAMLQCLARDQNINKRRASLVLLTGPVRYSDAGRLSGLAFAQIERLKSERDIRITKAVSWLLRTLTLHHKAAVAAYLKVNAQSLPRIALRETLMKLKTGAKTKRSAKP